MTWDTQITVTRKSLSLLIGRRIPLDEWMLISSLRETSSTGTEPRTQHFWNPVDENYGVYLNCTISPSDLQAYMVASKKYLSKALWLALVEAENTPYDVCVKKYGNNFLVDMMRDVLSKINVPSHCNAEHVAYWSD